MRNSGSNKPFPEKDAVPEARIRMAVITPVLVVLLLLAILPFSVSAADAPGKADSPASQTGTGQAYTILTRELSADTRALLPPGVTFGPSSFPFVFSERYGRGLKLVPALEGREAIIQHVTSQAPTPLLIEAIIFLPYRRKPPAGGSAESPVRKPTVEELALLFNQFSSLQGISYWSASRSRMRTLYVASYRITDPSKRKKIEDPRTLQDLLSLPPRSFAYQKDQTFDGIVLEISIEFGHSAVIMRNRNVTPLSMLSIPLLPADAVRAGFLAAPLPDGILLYFVSSLLQPAIARERVLESASNKALALLQWFVREAEARHYIEPLILPWNSDDIPHEARLEGN